jgi:hypothetical protein
MSVLSQTTYNAPHWKPQSDKLCISQDQREPNSIFVTKSNKEGVAYLMSEIGSAGRESSSGADQERISKETVAKEPIV